jgi:hypothetical protein
LYDGALDTRIAVFDGSRFPINDVAFHPTESMVAIGTGCYDGGWSFNGDLWIWNWESGEVASLLHESRDVAQCRWLDDGHLAAILRPRNEEEFDYEKYDAFKTYVGVIIENFQDARSSRCSSTNWKPDPRLAGLEPIEPASLGFATPPRDHREMLQQFSDVLGTTTYERRARVWDLLWLSDDRLAATHDYCHVEVWDTNSSRKIQEYKGVGFGVQLFQAKTHVLVHVIERTGDFECDNRSMLYRMTKNGLTAVRAFDYTVTVTMDAAGNLLCRDTGDWRKTRERTDMILGPSNETLVCKDLGFFDAINHYIRLDGREGLYFLQGTPPSSYADKRLCRVRLDGDIESVIRWDKPDAHAAMSTACWISHSALARACHLYGPRPSDGVSYIERMDIETATSAWRVPLNSPPTSLVVVGNRIVFALTDGTFGVVTANTGAKELETELEMDGVPIVATAMASRGERVAVGTSDGRVLVFELR